MSEKDDREYGEWFHDLWGNPTSGGAKGCLFYFVIIPIMIICGVLGLTLFTPGTYPVLLLLAPGGILGIIVLNIYGYITYKLPTILSIILSIILTIIGFKLVFVYGFVLLRKYL